MYGISHYVRALVGSCVLSSDISTSTVAPGCDIMSNKSCTALRLAAGRLLHADFFFFLRSTRYRETNNYAHRWGGARWGDPGTTRTGGRHLPHPRWRPEC